MPGLAVGVFGVVECSGAHKLGAVVEDGAAPAIDDFGEPVVVVVRCLAAGQHLEVGGFGGHEGVGEVVVEGFGRQGFAGGVEGFLEALGVDVGVLVVELTAGRHVVGRVDLLLQAVGGAGGLDACDEALGVGVAGGPPHDGNHGQEDAGQDGHNADDDQQLHEGEAEAVRAVGSSGVHVGLVLLEPTSCGCRRCQSRTSR